jgi:2-(3-amino-3-carboxypropyl)histidine synthase
MSDPLHDSDRDSEQHLVTIQQPTPTKQAKQLQQLNKIPDDILYNQDLNDMIHRVAPNYNFEIHKTVWRIRQAKATCVALQFPEGLLMFACPIADIIEKFCKCETVVNGDVTFGACCVDDYSSKAVGADFLVHYAHSCLIPVDQCKMNILYVFVEISIDLNHFISSIKQNFESGNRVALVSTIQFASSLRTAKLSFDSHFKSVLIPQEKPLSPGEILGCTSPQIKNCDILIYLGDGRFHLESSMIMNPTLKAYKYDPYSKKLTEEKYDHTEMHSIRQDAIHVARDSTTFGIILGTLGRQGSTRILDHIEEIMQKNNKKYFVLLLSEIHPQKLALFKTVDAWVQIACPRLSIDWGYAFSKPLLTSYEIEVALGTTQWKEVYPMDFYSTDGGEWTVKYGEKKKKSQQDAEILKRIQQLKMNKI